MRCLTACITRNPATALTFSKLYSQPDYARWPCTPSEMLTSGVHMSLYTVGLLWMIIVREIALILFLHILVKTFSTIPFSSVFFLRFFSFDLFSQFPMSRWMGFYGSKTKQRLASFNMDWSFHILVLILSQPACKLEQLLLLLH
jgi:hypothetical protein